MAGDRHCTGRIFSRLLPIFDLYECTNKMVLSTRSLKPARDWFLLRLGLKPQCFEPASGSPKSIFFKGHGPTGLPMSVPTRHIAIIAAFALAGTLLGGCSSINEKMGPVVGDTLPQWAGGLPKDVPPRKGTPEYDAYMKEQERKRLEPAPANANAAAPQSSPQSLDPVH
ncbi:MAG TPA: hypothetical protein VIY68_02520 [Steroidobacteraceae bacterium]|uniref:hypothetical protein n=1 Tax=Bradyrhizobium sp. TaxID=376 RepID=UPI002F71CCD9